MREASPCHFLANMTTKLLNLSACKIYEMIFCRMRRSVLNNVVTKVWGLVEVRHCLIPSGRVLHVEVILCVITNCDQLPWVNFLFSQSLAGGKHYHKILSQSLELSPRLAIPGCFPYILCYPYHSPYVILVGLLLQYVALLQSRGLV